MCLEVITLSNMASTLIMTMNSKILSRPKHVKCVLGEIVKILNIVIFFFIEKELLQGKPWSSSGDIKMYRIINDIQGERSN